jgi:DNA-binding transcriptional ArsR family regulator
MAHDPPGPGLPLLDAERFDEAVFEILKPGSVRILVELVAKPMAVHELTERVPVERCTVSNTLSVLGRLGVVSHVKQKTSHVYRTNPRIVSMPEKGELRLRFRTRDGGRADMAIPVHEPSRPFTAR